MRRPKRRAASASVGPAPDKSAQHTRERLQGLALIAAAVVIYAPALRGGWLWDDHTLVSHNDLIHDPAGLWKVVSQPDGLGYYDPLTSAVHWLQWQAWGDNTFGGHLTSLGLHVAGGLLLWRLFHRLGLAFAWLGALVFTVYPLAVESVAWIAELKNPLSLVPLLLSMLAFLDCEEKGWRAADFFRALGWFAVAMLAKTSGMMLPVIILGYAAWKRGTIGLSDLKRSAPFFLVACVAAFVSVLPHFAPSHQQQIAATAGLADRCATVGWAGLLLLGKVLFPVGLTPVYPGEIIKTVTLPDLLPWLGLIVGIGLCWSRRATWGWPVLAGLGFFVVNLVPVLGFIAMNSTTMVWSMDHLVYVPMIGVIGLFAFGVEKVMCRLSPGARSLARVALVLLVAWLTLGSREYAVAFADEETLWRHAVETNPNVPLARENLGNMLLDDQPEEARKQYEALVRLDPQRAVSHEDLGRALMLDGQPEEAREQFELLVQLDPQRAASHDELGRALVKLGKLPEGIAEYQRALALDPTQADVENNFGVALMQSNRFSESIPHFVQAIHLKPDYSLAYDNLGVAYAGAGQYQQAVDSFTQALELTPNSAPTHDNLANALLKLGRREEASRQFEEALRIQPDDAAAQNGLAKLPGTN